jgi:hypothetical protein
MLKIQRSSNGHVVFTLSGRDGISFLKRCEADAIKLKNCPAYIREWITGERR